MEPSAEKVSDRSSTVDDRNPSRAFMIVGVFVALVLALAGAAVLYVYLQPQNTKMAETRSMSVTQMQPAQLVETTADTVEEANARAAADKLLAESLNRQATQISQATAQANQALPANQTTPANPQAVAAPPAMAAQPSTTPYADAANAEATSPAAAAVQNVADNATPDPQSTGSTQPAAATQPAAGTQVAMLQPKAEANVQKTDIPAPPPVETPKVQAAPQSPAPVTMSADEIRRLLARATNMVQQGDIASARLVLDRLARYGDARAAFALAETFDPRMLAQWNVRGIKPDPTRAKTYYSQAAKAGIGEARDRLTELGN
jgi:hypothetical protein